MTSNDSNYIYCLACQKHLDWREAYATQHTLGHMRQLFPYGTYRWGQLTVAAKALGVSRQRCSQLAKTLNLKRIKE